MLPLKHSVVTSLLAVLQDSKQMCATAPWSNSAIGGSPSCRLRLFFSGARGAAEAVEVTAATTDDTIAEPIFRGGIGIRETGFDATFISDDGASSGVVLGFMQPTALPAGEAVVVLELTVEPEDGECTCRLSLTDDVDTIGQPVSSVLVAEGFSWPIDGPTVKVDTCGG
ncbi:MAG: hypothetical protein ACI8RZ_003801 [Myxococcota bacterium]